MASRETVESKKRKASETEANSRKVKPCVDVLVGNSVKNAQIDSQSTKNTVLERNRVMFNNSELSDISFTCNNSDVPFFAHKYVLAVSSDVFKAMFYGDLAEKGSVLHISDADGESLLEFLRYLYTDTCQLTMDNVVGVMYLSKKYIVPALSDTCANFWKNSLKPDNVVTILENARHFDEKKLEARAWEVIDWHIKRVAALGKFKRMKQKTLSCLLKRSSLDISEVELFQAVLKWCDFQCSEKGLGATAENRRAVLGVAIYDLRFLAMEQVEFAKYVATSSLLTPDEMIPIYNKFNGVASPTLKWKLSQKRFNWAKGLHQLSKSVDKMEKAVKACCQR